MNFDPTNITLVTLVGYFEAAGGQQQRHVQIPIAPEVQDELKVMLDLTLLKLGLPQATGQLPDFSPAEKYSGEEPCKLPLATAYMAMPANGTIKMVTLWAKTIKPPAFLSKMNGKKHNRKSGGTASGIFFYIFHNL